MDWSMELNAAREAATAATQVILSQYEKLDAKASAPADITTQTDRDSQEAILQLLSGRFPADAFRAEEATPTLSRLRNSCSRVPSGGGLGWGVGTFPPPQPSPTRGEGENRMWIIDPIDGTRGFVTKNGEFSVMIALCVDGVPVVGVVAEPAKNIVTWATQGGGCWQSKSNGETRRVLATTTAELSQSTVILSHMKPGKEPPRQLQLLKPLKVIETYSAGVKLARVADGTADLYVCDYMAMNDWDLAAGHILVTEAGGQVSNLQGEPRIYGRESPKQLGGLLATNGRLHDAAIRLLTRSVER